MAMSNPQNNRYSNANGNPRGYDTTQPIDLGRVSPAAPASSREEKTSYACEAPYPTIQVSERNPKYAQIVMTYLASQNSELTSVTQYCYQNWILLAKHPKLAKDLSGIAKVEMHHIDILGQTALLLGGDPHFVYPAARRYQHWNSYFLSSVKTPKEILKLDIESEHNTIQAYMTQAEKITDPQLAAIFKRLSLDEEVHLQLFRKHLETIS